MTKRDTFIEKDVMMNVVMNIQDWDSSLPMPTILKPRPLWTGKQVGGEWGGCRAGWCARGIPKSWQQGEGLEGSPGHSREE